MFIYFLSIEVDLFLYKLNQLYKGRRLISVPSLVGLFYLLLCSLQKALLVYCLASEQWTCFQYRERSADSFYLMLYHAFQIACFSLTSWFDTVSELSGWGFLCLVSLNLRSLGCRSFIFLCYSILKHMKMERESRDFASLLSWISSLHSFLKRPRDLPRVYWVEGPHPPKKIKRNVFFC